MISYTDEGMEWLLLVQYHQKALLIVTVTVSLYFKIEIDHKALFMYSALKESAFSVSLL